VFRWFNQVAQVLRLRPRIDEELWEELEEALIAGDVSASVAFQMVSDLRDKARAEAWTDASQVSTGFRDEVARLLKDDDPGLSLPDTLPAVYLLVGVNGTGKTTSAAKLAWDIRQSGKTVLLAAADTFRAAAIDQLEVWAERAGVEMVRHQPNSDPSAVVFDAIEAARARGVDIVIADTAGRLHTRANLMQELAKLGRVTEKCLGRPPDETLLVLDATTGQNAVNQARQFGAATPLTGVILTKMDGTARGGVVLTLAREMGIPVKFIGIGEKISDLRLFDAAEYADGLFRLDGDGDAAPVEAVTLEPVSEPVVEPIQPAETVDEPSVETSTDEEAKPLWKRLFRRG
jgi:fused signal recognition particle receptor